MLLEEEDDEDEYGLHSIGPVDTFIILMGVGIGLSFVLICIIETVYNIFN